MNAPVYDPFDAAVLCRTLRRDVELHGQRLRRGQPVMARRDQPAGAWFVAAELVLLDLVVRFRRRPGSCAVHHTGTTLRSLLALGWWLQRAAARLGQ